MYSHFLKSSHYVYILYKPYLENYLERSILAKAMCEPILTKSKFNLIDISAFYVPISVSIYCLEYPSVRHSSIALNTEQWDLYTLSKWHFLEAWRHRTPGTAREINYQLQTVANFSL